MTSRATAHVVPPTAGRSSRSPRWSPILVVVAVLLTFGRLTTARFTWFDDHPAIAENPHFNPPSWRGVGYYWTHADPEIYAPLTYTLWGALAAVTYVPTPDERGVHVDARLYHAANVLLHAAAALCVYGLLLEFGCGGPWAAAAGAMLFALHPLQVEAVAWATGTRDVLSGALALLALLLYVRGARAGPGRTARGWFAASTVAFALALLAKPGAITMPLVAVILGRLILDRPWRRVIPAAVAWGVIALPLVLVNWLAQHAAHASALPRWYRVFLPGDALTFYAWKLLLPIRLGIHYGLRPTEMMHHPWAFAGWLVPLLVALLIWRSRRRWLAAAALIFAVAPLPVLGFLPFDWQWYAAVADHYLYVAMLGPAIALAFALAATRRRGPVIATGIYLAALAALSFRQAGFWRDNTTLADHALDVNPRSFIAHTMLGTDQLSTDPSAAADQYRAAFDIDPTYGPAAGALKRLLDSLGRTDEARDAMIRGLAANEALPPAEQFDATDSYRELAHFFESRGDPTRAADYYRKILRAHPADADATDGLQRLMPH